jgi:phospholipid/cholesterol/gamma-HCH transport system substrate-binding protein
MLESLARLGDVGTRIINESSADTVEDLKLLQPILTQLAAAGPDLAGSLDLLLTYPFPASSLTALNYRQDQRTGGYGLFTNMTATVELDLTQTLCRYVIDPATGALKTLRPEDIPTGQCGQAGTPPGNQAGSGSGGSGTTVPGLELPGLPGDLVGSVPGVGGQTAVPGLPDILGVQQ